MRRRQRDIFNAWPGYVDILANLLMIIIFFIVFLLAISGYLERTLRGVDLEKNLIGQQYENLKKDYDKLRELKDSEIMALEQELRKQLAAIRLFYENEKIPELTKTYREELEQLNAALQRTQAELDQNIEKTKLSYYRSEFFTKLRQVLGEREDVVVKGDRFVLTSEIIFEKGSAALKEKGKQTLEKLAEIIKDITPEIPENVDWVLRVDGHTDRLPVKSKYESNRHLSFARAMSVVKYLESKGIPGNRLLPSGFGEFDPLPGTEDKKDAAENRRIVFRLDSK